MEEPTLPDAVALIARMKTSLPECDVCQVLHTSAFICPEPNVDNEPEWEPLPDRCGFIKRCATCATGQRFPWADRLDAERVLAHMKTKDGVWELKELEALT